MSSAVSLLIVSATLAFGAVYSWGYVPLFAAAACIGLTGVVRQRGVLPDAPRTLSAALLLVALAVGGQLVPVPRTTLDYLGPHAADLLSRYSLTFAGSTGAHPLSISPTATALALLGFAGLGVYLTGLPGLLSRRDLRALPRNLMLFAVPLALVGIFGSEHNNGLVYGFWQPQDGTNGNGFGPFINRNHFAGWMLMATALSLGYLIGRVEGAARDLKPGPHHRLVWFSSPEANQIALTAAAILVMAVSLVWTMSRSGITSFMCVAACFAWLIVRRRGVGAGRRAVGLAGVGIVLLTAVTWRGVDELLKWFGDTGDLISRFAAWQDGWRVVRDFPIFGTGLNTYWIAMLYYQTSLPDYLLAQAHNDYLQLLVEGGLLVTIAAAVAVLCLVVVIRRNLEAARHESRGYWIRAGAAVGLIGIAVQETVEFSLQMPANAFLFCTLAAIAMAPVENRRLPREPQ